MMRLLRYGVAVLILMGFAAISVHAADNKIAVVDFQKILEVSNAGKAAQAEINKQGKQMESDLKEKGSEIEDMEKKLDRESLVMSKEMRDEKQRDLRIKVSDFKALQQKYMEDFKLLENKIISKIQKEVVEIIQEYGKKDNFMLIVEKRTGGVIYAQQAVDITESIIQLYNAQSPEKAEGATEKKK
ncbi:MAG: OmpH family outer membrane protein [Desulfatirhabdiaceae bacterium]